MLISIEGGIGSGKSQLLEDLQSQLHLSAPHLVIQEDVADWTSFCDHEGRNILERYYQDKSKFSYCFQTLVLVSRIHHIVSTLKANPNTIIFTERSHLTDLLIFAKTLYEQQAMTQIEWLTYNKCHSFLSDMLNINVDMVLYLRTDPDVCMNRIKLRNRKGEDLIPMEYVKTLHQKHDDWLIINDNVSSVIVLDGNIDCHDAYGRKKQLDTIADMVEHYLSLNCPV
jgi:deoxyadenosine/deoxycytidine kinase